MVKHKFLKQFSYASKGNPKSIANMYDVTYYTPKINRHTYGESLSTYYGVTQGRKTSTNVFSFNTSDMPSHITV